MKKYSSWLWALPAMAALFTLASIFTLPSGAEKSLVLGLSAQRLALALFPLVCLLLSLAMLWMAFAAPERYARTTAAFRRVSPGAARLSGALSFWAAFFLVGFFLVYRMTIAPDAAVLTLKLGALFPALAAYLDRLQPVLLLLAFYLGGWSWYTARVLKAPFLQNPGLLATCGAGVFSLFAGLFQWVVFLFRLHVFEQIPGWYWPIIVKPDFARHAALFGVFLLFSLLIVVLIRRSPQAVFRNLLLISLLFIGLQYAIGFMEGRGAASLADRFFLSYHRVYIEEACNADISARQAVIGYEDNYPSMFFQTKPPGVLWTAFQIKRVATLPGISALLERLSANTTLSEVLPTLESPACRRSMALAVYTFPLLAASTIWLLYGFSRWVIRGKETRQLGATSALLFALAPNIVMLALFPDQVFYPPLFLLAAGGILIAIREKSFLACFGIGAALYGVIFLTFSMLPLLILPVFYFACLLWQENKLGRLWPDFKKTLLPMGLGGLLSLVVLRIFLNYDIFTRTRRMMATRIEGDFYTRLDIPFTGEAMWFEKIRQAWQAALLNNIELAAAIGFPIFIFFAAMGVRSLIHVLRRTPDESAPVNASLFLTYVALNALRVVLGEAARLWMFWVPVMALLAVQFILPAIRRSRWFMILFIVLQLGTVFLTYQFQDYWMPQLLP